MIPNVDEVERVRNIRGEERTCRIQAGNPPAHKTDKPDIILRAGLLDPTPYIRRCAKPINQTHYSESGPARSKLKIRQSPKPDIIWKG